MKCIYCGGRVVWDYPIIDGVSKCEKCDSKNCHEIDHNDVEGLDDE